MSLNVQGMTPLIQVFDMPSSLAFYRDKLGFEVMQTSGQGDQSGWVMLKLNDAALMLNTMYEDPDRPLAPDLTRKSNHNAAYNYFLSNDIEVGKPYLTGYGFNAIDITDPDGYNLCFYWPAE